MFSAGNFRKLCRHTEPSFTSLCTRPQLSAAEDYAHWFLLGLLGLYKRAKAFLCGVMKSSACNTLTDLPSSVDAGAEGMQDSGHVSVFYGSDPRRLHHQPRIQLGGPSGPERLPAARQPGGKPEARAQHGGEDGKNTRWHKRKKVQYIKEL